jgi:hypothetical protein
VSRRSRFRFVVHSVQNAIVWLRSIRAVGNPSDSKFNLTVGELAPIFDNGPIATNRTFVEDLAGLSPSLFHRQSEIFMWQAVIVAFALVAKIARPIRDTERSSHCVNLNVGGSRSDYRNEAFYNSNLNNFNPAFALISMVKIESKGPQVRRASACEQG